MPRGGKKGFGIGVLHGGKQRFRAGFFNYFTKLHHCDFIGHIGHHSQIMGDHYHPHLVLFGKLFQQPQDLRLGGDIQCCGRLIRN